MIHALLLALTTGLHPPAMQHQWALLLLTSAERIDIDTASIQVLGPRVRRVWLRWNLHLAASTGRGPRHEPQYEFEHRDLDCVNHRTRIIEKRQESRSMGSGESIGTSESTWHEPANGSLLAQVFDAACRLTKAGA